MTVDLAEHGPEAVFLEEIRERALPLGSRDDLDPLLDQIGDPRFVLLGEASHAAFGRWPTWMWANEEVAELIDWLRDHNLSTGAVVGFYGLATSRERDTEPWAS
jgi:erythromycin esterase-like protein